jgi:hypothetical protein
MGKARQPRTLCITDAGLRATKEVQDLEAKGHKILSWEETGNLVQPDLILGPNCRMVTPETVKYVGLALKELGKASKPVLETQTLAVEKPETKEDDDELSMG